MARRKLQLDKKEEKPEIRVLVINKHGLVREISEKRSKRLFRSIELNLEDRARSKKVPEHKYVKEGWRKMTKEEIAVWESNKKPFKMNFTGAQSARNLVELAETNAENEALKKQLAELQARIAANEKKEGGTK